MNSKNYKITLGMATYEFGKGKFLETFNSILNQSFKNFELIILEEYSVKNDNRIENLIKPYKNIKYYKNSKRLGIVGSSNKLLNLANSDTDFFGLISDHDIYEQDWLLELINIITQDQNISFIYPLTEEIDENGNTIRNSKKIIKADGDSVFLRVKEILSFNKGFGYAINSGIFKYLDINRIKGMKEIFLPDTVLLIETSIFGKIYCHNKILYKKRIFDTNYTTKNKMLLRQRKNIFFNKYNLIQYINYKFGIYLYFFYKFIMSLLKPKDTYKYFILLILLSKKNSLSLIKFIMKLFTRNKLMVYFYNKLR